MSATRTSLLYDYAEKIGKLSIDEQLKLIELISMNLVKNLHIEEENQDDDPTQFNGKSQANRSADEIVAEIRAEREKNIRSDKPAQSVEKLISNL